MKGCRGILFYCPPNATADRQRAPAPHSIVRYGKGTQVHRHGHGMHQQPARQDTWRVVTRGHVQQEVTVPRGSVREKNTREITP